MSEEDRALAKRENTSLTRLIGSFAMACVYGTTAFFAIWKLKDAVPSFLVSVLPDVDQSNPVRLYTYITILVSGIVWFVSFTVLWQTLNKITNMRKRLTKLAIWCAGAAGVYLIGMLLLSIALRIR